MRGLGRRVGKEGEYKGVGKEGGYKGVGKEGGGWVQRVGTRTGV